MIRPLLIAAVVPDLVAFIPLTGVKYRVAQVLLSVVLTARSILSQRLGQNFANLLGVGRDVDLLRYLTIVASIPFAIVAVRKFSEWDQKIATIVMELDIDRGRVECGTESNNDYK